MAHSDWDQHKVDLTRNDLTFVDLIQAGCRVQLLKFTILLNTMKAELCRLQELLPTSTLPGFVLVPLQSCLLPVPPTNITVSAGYVA